MVMYMKTVVTHSGKFHADDVFAVATFHLLLGQDEVKVVRSRDETVIATADYVVDVGGVYDHATCRYDHHQPGAPARENGIPYAGFGLVWRHYGEEICGSEVVASQLDSQLVQPIDANDNGVSLYTLNEPEIRLFEVSNVIGTFRAGSGADEETWLACFMKAVDFARGLLERMIVQQQNLLTLQAYVDQVYQAAADKQLVVFDQPIHAELLIDFPEVRVVVYPDASQEGYWRASAVPKTHHTFACRVYFPSAWSGLRDAELQAVSGLPDAVFCHKSRHLSVFGSKESALAAARLAE